MCIDTFTAIFKSPKLGDSMDAQRRYDMRHEMLTQRNPFCHHVNAKKGTLSQHFVTHVVPPLMDANEHNLWGEK
jgi:hypothetical protein